MLVLASSVYYELDTRRIKAAVARRFECGYQSQDGNYIREIDVINSALLESTEGTGYTDDEWLSSHNELCPRLILDSVSGR